MFNFNNHQLWNQYDQYYAFHKESLHYDFYELYKLNFEIWLKIHFYFNCENPQELLENTILRREGKTLLTG